MEERLPQVKAVLRDRSTQANHAKDWEGILNMLITALKVSSGEAAEEESKSTKSSDDGKVTVVKLMPLRE